jgi:transcriptional regulator with XRE-family HTH domain
MENTEKAENSVGARIREGREKAGMSQETLAERLGVSRQAVSKWEMGTSTPTPENLKALSEVLGISFEVEPEDKSERPSPGPWKTVTLVCLAACLLLLVGVVWLLLLTPSTSDEAEPSAEADGQQTEDAITGVTFFDAQGQRLHPDQGDNWLVFSTGSQVLTAVTFRSDLNVNGVALYLTPTGTETYDLREQLALCSVENGDTVALLLWEVPESLMGHMDIVLECDGGQTYSQMFNVIADG